MEPTIEVNGKSFEALITPQEIEQKVRELAQQLEQDLGGKDPLLVCVLNGALYFAADLTRMLNFPCELTSVKVASYTGMESGEIKETAQIKENIENRDVVILEDIVDTGKTAAYLKKQLIENRASSVSLMTVFFKKEALEKDLTPDYIGFEVPNNFLIGYGLDYDKRGRNLKGVYKLKN